MIEFIKSIFHPGAKPVPEVCDDCEIRPATAWVDSLHLCAGCASEDEDYEDPEDRYDNADW